jgi:long-chain acyl-CoA synthetase
MTGSVINHIVAGTPPAGHRIRFVRMGSTQEIDLRELWRQTGRLAVALRERGLRLGDRVGILAENGLEWVLLDLAALRIGAVTVGFDVAKFTTGSDLRTRYNLTLLAADSPAADESILTMADVGRLAVEGPQRQPGPIEYRPDDVTTLKLTSGSTGEPKSMTASVGSIDNTIGAVQEMFGHGEGDDLFVFLPLSLLQQRFWIYSALRYGHDVTVSTYQAAFGALAPCRPTVVMGVPGFYRAARTYVELRARTLTAGTADPERTAARKVFGDRIRYLWTGSAPADARTLDFFERVGLPIYEGYGLNETCIVTKNYPGARRPGSVGRVLPGKQVLIGPDGVISVRAQHPVAAGYEQAPPGVSEQVFRASGVVRTGDLGHLDPDGYLFVRGRADDVIVLQNGRKVAVHPIEERLQAGLAIESCVVYCLDQIHLVAVVSPSAQPTDQEAIVAQVAVANALACPDEQISAAIVADEPFSVANGLLSSQFKPRRLRILELYRGRLTDVLGGHLVN